MSMTRFNWFSDAWTRVKNHCRTTMAKEFTERAPTEGFKRSILIAEHSPIRLLEFDWTWEGMPYWVHAEWARHKFEKFVSSQRDDRVPGDVPRAERRQDAPVTFDGYANMQQLIDAWRKRLCHQATDEARSYAEDLKRELAGTHPDEALVLVPNCVYRWGCPEMRTCGLFRHFEAWCRGNGVRVGDIPERYEAYRDFCDERQ